MIKTKNLYANGNVTVSMIGLGIGAHNYRQRIWQFLFLMEATHKLKLTVRKIKGGSIEEETVYELKGGDEWHISCDTAVRPKESAYHGNDERNVKYISDFSSSRFYGRPLKINATKLPPFTKLSIEDGMLYTRTITKNKYKVKVQGKERGTSEPVGKEIGCELSCKVGGMLRIISKNSPGIVPEIRVDEGCTYEIDFDNNCTSSPKPGEDDFNVYNKYFVQEGTKLDYSVTLSEDLDPGEKRPPCRLGILTTGNGELP